MEKLTFTQFEQIKKRISREEAVFYAGLFYSTDTGLKPVCGIMKANYGMTNRAYQALLWGELLEIWGYICMGGAYHIEGPAPYFIHVDHRKKQFNYGYC